MPGGGAAGDTSPLAGWCLAYGVVLHATDDGLVVESDKIRRVRLRDPRLERMLVEALEANRDLADLAREHDPHVVVRALDCLRDIGAVIRLPERVVIIDRLGIGRGFEPRARRVFRAETPLELAASDFAVLIARRDDVFLGEALDRCHLLAIPALVVWASSAEIVAVHDDARTSPCARCALLFDARAPAERVVLPATKIATANGGQLRVAQAFAAAVAARFSAPGSLPVGHASVWNLDKGISGGHAFLRHPSCPCASRTIRREPTEAPCTSWDELARARFSAVVPLGERGAIARATYRGGRSPWPLSQESFGVAIAAGPFSRERAVAEGIERFAMLHAPPDMRGRARQTLEAPAIDLDAIAALTFRHDERSADGFRFPEMSDALVLDWSWAVRASTDERVLVPTSLVGRPSKGSARLVDATSNGYACHPDLDEAKLRALLEVIERDALLASWYAGLELALVADANAPAGAVVFVATQDIDLPVVLVASCLTDGSLRIGSAAGTSFDIALTRALFELQGQLMVPPSTREAAPDLDRGDRGYGPRDHVAFYAGARGHAVLDRWKNAARHANLGEMQRRWPDEDPLAKHALGAAVDVLRRADLDVLFVDRSLPELFGPHCHVARALVPGAVEMSWGMTYRRLASPRITRWVAGGAELSTWPHPFG
jgi:thiazole/oxazole-forming peptide maturase SagD family component